MNLLFCGASSQTKQCKITPKIPKCKTNHGKIKEKSAKFIQNSIIYVENVVFLPAKTYLCIPN